MGKGRRRAGGLTPQRACAPPLSLALKACVILTAAAGAALPLAGCTTTIVPPQSVERPQPVFVLDHGRHTSLVLPQADGLVRYAYGDWDWYAEVRTGATEATRAVFWPTRAGLGRRLVQGTATKGGVRRGVAVGIEHLHELRVEADDVDALRASLEAIYRANHAHLKYNAHYDLVFVPHPDPYTLWNNSNRRVAHWLRQLGCTLHGSALWASWQVEAGTEEVLGPDAAAQGHRRAR